MLTNKQVTIIAAASYIAGGMVASVLTRYYLKNKYQVLFDKELEDIRAYYGKMASRKKRGRKYEDMTKAYGGENVATVMPEPEIEITFYEVEEEGTIPLNIEDELPSRTEDEPYVISKEEFDNDCQEYDKINLTYFEQDDVIIGDSITPLEDVDLIIGNENLNKFGYGSKRKDVVYIRNEALETDWEVTRTSDAYSKQVLGFIQHSEGRKTKFRREEE